MSDEQRAWTGGVEAKCPCPSTHDKLQEAHYFVHQMVDHYHEPDQFRFSLSAFLQASRSVTFFLQTEAASSPGMKSWYQATQASLAADADLKALNSLRVQTVHKTALAVNSRARIGMYKHGSCRLALPMIPMKPDTDGFTGLITARMLLDDFNLVNPQRVWIGEEIGIDREWILEELPGREITKVCIDSLEQLRRIVWDAHEAHSGIHHPFPEEGCRHSEGGYTVIRESQMFPEIVRAWDGELPEILSAGPTGLRFLAGPSPAAPIWHELMPGQKARAWVGAPSTHWGSGYVSALLHSIKRKRVDKRTAVFFAMRDASVSPGRGAAR
jgi:hypothetical protein